MDWERAAPVIIDAVAALGCHVDKLEELMLPSVIYRILKPSLL